MDIPISWRNVPWYLSSWLNSLYNILRRLLLRFGTAVILLRVISTQHQGVEVESSVSEHKIKICQHMTLQVGKWYLPPLAHHTPEIEQNIHRETSWNYYSTQNLHFIKWCLIINMQWCFINETVLNLHILISFHL